MRLSFTFGWARMSPAWLLVLAVPGCTNIKNDGDRTRAEGALAGAAVGTAAGVGAGALAGKNKSAAMAAGGLAGAQLGSMAGAAYGHSVAKKKEGYATQEGALDRQIKSLRTEISERKQYNQTVRQEVAAKERQLAKILASDRSQGPTVDDYDLRTTIDVRLREIDRRARSWQETIDAHKAILKKAVDDPQSAELQTGIDRLTSERAELLRQRTTLSGMPGRLTP